MPRKKVIKKNMKKFEVEAYSHEGLKRKNNPPVGLVSSATDKINGKTKYQHDPHIDPYLSWAGKKEGTSFEVQNVSLHIHERIDPKRIIKSFLKKDTAPKQMSIFEQPDYEPPLHKAIDFYKHEQDWTNRLIAGDSLLVMNSLLNKEGIAGKVQMIYIDPPYGIKYGSNFQPFINKRDVKDGKDEDLTQEPEMIKAFRDTWKNGIHSYLSYLRDRLLLARELLTESGSIFVQISDENVHLVRCLMDEVFGEGNFVCMITFSKTRGQVKTNTTPVSSDYLIHFAKDKEKIKFHPIYKKKVMGDEGTAEFKSVEMSDGTIRRITDSEYVNPSLLPSDAKIFATTPIVSAGYSENGSRDIELDWKGKKLILRCGNKRHWSVGVEGTKKLWEIGRLLRKEGLRIFKSYLSDFPYSPLTNVWTDTRGETDMSYVVQTNRKVIERCVLMTTDPGDLIFDPTCGSGTTAYVAEQWGCRWITCDTSRVSITLAKQRLMTALFDFYELAHPIEGVGSGFRYQTVDHITRSSLAKGAPPEQETLYDQPFIERNKVRVTGPFTVEAVPCLRVKPFDAREPKIEGTGRELAQTGETGNQTLWRDELKSTGIRTLGGKVISFSRVEPMIATRFLHAEGEILEANGENKKAVISFGPDYGLLEQRQVEEAIKEARSLKEKPDFVIFAAFHFDPEAAKDIDQIKWQGVKILKTQMNGDLLTSDLRNKRSSNQSYWLIGQPDVEVKKHKDGKYSVIVHGFDYYNPIMGEIESKSNNHIAMWFLDTDYDERSLFPIQVFFPQGDAKQGWTKLAKALKAEVDENLLEVFTGTESLPFEAGEEKKIAVKIIDNRGIESFVIKNLD